VNARQYSIHFLDRVGRVVNALEIERGTDEAAIEEAHRLDVSSIGPGFDVWHGRRLVHQHRRNRYSVDFRNQHGLLIGRDDFTAEDDKDAIAIAQTLADACSDRCSHFVLWQRRRRVAARRSTTTSSLEISARVQEIVLEREFVIQASKCAIADSARLLGQTHRLLGAIRQRAL